jgi:hypothetical protein
MLRKEGGDREMVDILSLILDHDESAVLRAVELALESEVKEQHLQMVGLHHKHLILMNRTLVIIVG